MALIVLCAFPVFASTPEQDMVLIVDEGDGEFSGLEQVSDEEMAQVEGNREENGAGSGPGTNFHYQIYKVGSYVPDNGVDYDAFYILAGNMGPLGAGVINGWWRCLYL